MGKDTFLKSGVYSEHTYNSTIRWGKVQYCLVDNSDINKFEKYGGWGGINTIEFIFIDSFNDKPTNLKYNNIQTAIPLLSNDIIPPIKNEIVLILESPSSNYTVTSPQFEYKYLGPINLYNHPHHNSLPNKSDKKDNLDLGSFKEQNIPNHKSINGGTSKIGRQGQSFRMYGGGFKEKGFDGEDSSGGINITIPKFKKLEDNDKIKSFEDGYLETPKNSNGIFISPFNSNTNDSNYFSPSSPVVQESNVKDYNKNILDKNNKTNTPNNQIKILNPVSDEEKNINNEEDIFETINNIEEDLKTNVKNKNFELENNPIFLTSNNYNKSISNSSSKLGKFNIGNIKDKNGKFLSFNSREEGKQALINQLRLYQTGKSKTGVKPNFTLYEAMDKYAPSSDKNNPKQYSEFIAKKIGITINTPIKDIDLNKWAEAIAIFEGNDK